MQGSAPVLELKGLTEKGKGLVGDASFGGQELHMEDVEGFAGSR